MSVLWMEPYETDNFPQQVEGILQQTKPLYDKLHAFTRMKLREQGQDTGQITDSCFAVRLANKRRNENK